MFKFTVAFSLLLFSLHALSQKAKPSKGYVINGHLEGASNAKIFLQEASVYKDSQVSDSTVADKDGRFVFHGMLTEPSYYQLMVANKNNSAWFILENSPVTITGNADSLKTVEIKGSHEQDVSKLSSMVFQDTALKSLAERARKDMEKGVSNKDSTLIAAASKAEAQVMEGYTRNALAFIEKYPNTSASIGLINLLVHTNNVKTADSVLANAEKGGFAHYSQVKALRKIIDANTKLIVGQPAMDFTQADTAGQQITLASFKGKYVLLDFWASWCGPCRQENPKVVEAYDLFRDKNFTVLSVSLDGDKSAWLNAIAKDQLLWTHVSDLKGWKNDVAIAYGITGVPTNYLLDPSGIIIAKNLRGDQLKSFLQKTLEK